MGTFGYLARSIFNLILVLLGAIAVIIIVATWVVNSTNYNDPRLIIESGSLRGQVPSSSEARVLYSVLQARADEINAPISNDPSLTPFIIESGETALTVADNLQAQGLISDARLFSQLLRYNGIDTKLQAGSYQLRRNMTMKEIGGALYRGRSARLTLNIPAGWRMEQLAQHLTTADIMDGNQFLRHARQGTVVDHYLLTDRPPGQSYEGYLLPDTYYLLDSARPEDLIAGMLNNMAGKLPDNAFELAQQQGLTFYEVLILASIVERETAIPAERALVASVYLNRLNPANGLPNLQADPTVQYAMGYQPDTGQWWKSPVQIEEYQLVDSPYNTYLYAGLPPGPIASPSLDSIMAVLQPADTNYLFFVCRRPKCEGGNHVFAETYAEHIENVTVYWGQ